jgi:hypothetical protein
MNIDDAANVPVGTEISMIVTNRRAQAESHNPVQGSGPWWMVQITPNVTCTKCHSSRPIGYFKASAHSIELALALAVCRWDDFEKEAAVEKSQSEQAAKQSEAKP